MLKSRTVSCLPGCTVAHAAEKACDAFLFLSFLPRCFWWFLYCRYKRSNESLKVSFNNELIVLNRNFKVDSFSIFSDLYSRSNEHAILSSGRRGYRLYCIGTQGRLFGEKKTDAISFHFVHFLFHFLTFFLKKQHLPKIIGTIFKVELLYKQKTFLKPLQQKWNEPILKRFCQGQNASYFGTPVLRYWLPIIITLSLSNFAK